MEGAAGDGGRVAARVRRARPRPALHHAADAHLPRDRRQRRPTPRHRRDRGQARSDPGDAAREHARGVPHGVLGHRGARRAVQREAGLPRRLDARGRQAHGADVARRRLPRGGAALQDPRAGAQERDEPRGVVLDRAPLQLRPAFPHGRDGRRLPAAREDRRPRDQPALRRDVHRAVRGRAARHPVGRPPARSRCARARS